MAWVYERTERNSVRWDPDAGLVKNPKLRVHNNTYLTRHSTPFSSADGGRSCLKDAEDVYPAVHSTSVEEQGYHPRKTSTA
jgi:hypothetical protein